MNIPIRAQVRTAAAKLAEARDAFDARTGRDAIAGRNLRKALDNYNTLKAEYDREERN